ncbi:16S rRNA (guanine(527)-N(7))-methyltransferase RsmG [Pollutimonas harenae]|uniref:Ribosomal RNA small subunit methyltransferase G n=1 Tax=Pollutimonas harenae TaxID=657015 RepID=A0A853GNL8_9BURK|nr:16S rRNA (guanine(527)-N(7))-methyltransferase RsmG [Pollutimonas harenae]NYT84618.1 16S rRNA (guanine(527)-N(7))-methyltransferase RsmG [Pollutimonas harenae]TEA72992.1 16S rRNA (guanine(527)-N(7))-methyltransferase RsmG [Pollutimonas harenae]
MGREQFGLRLQQAGQVLGVEIDPPKIDALLAYLDQLQRWNKTYNLTALRDPEQMLVQHLIDSLSVVKPIANILYKNTVLESTIADVGSGAGLPGVVLAIMHPNWEVHCIDAVEKKMAFVRQVSSVLRLRNLHAHHQRVESMQPLEADIVVSRAFASLADFATLAGRHVATDGHLVAMKGREPEEEAELLRQNTSWRITHIETLPVPELNAQRCLVWMSRQGSL